MVTIRCTRKLLKLMDGPIVEEPPAPSNVLGDWYANLIPTAAGNLIIFASEKTLLSVAIPAEQISQLTSLFVARVYNLLRMLEIPEPVVERELHWYRDIRLAKTSSRSVLGSLNEIALYYQTIPEQLSEQTRLSLSEAELELSKLLHSPLNYRRPVEVARDLLLGSSSNASRY
jgi:hypothetical protein